jgi:ssDNA-binding Zn-finger/Zn-ribbon topoisomerase 1
MQRKDKINLEKVRASLFTGCPHCQYAIPPNETQRVNFTEMKCPKCGRTFDPQQKIERGA